MKHSASRKGFRGAITSFLVVACVVAASTGALAANKLIVQDNAATPNDKFVVTDQGYIGAGTNSPLTALHVVGAGVVQSQVRSHNTGVTTNLGGGGFVGYHNNAAGSLPLNGDRLGYMFYGSMDGATPRNGGGLAARAEGNWTSTSIPTAFLFETTPTGSLTRVERMRINNAGNVGIGTATPSQKLEVNGGFRLSSTTAKSTCDATLRGTIWFTRGLVGEADTLEVCAKDATENYAWKAFY